MKRASKKTGRRLYQVRILEIYLLLYVFVKLQVFPLTSNQPSFTTFLALFLLIFCISFSCYLWKIGDFCVIWTVAFALHYVSFFVVLMYGNFQRCLLGFIKYCMLRNIYWTCWLFGSLFGLFSPETWERYLTARAPGQLKRRES